ncbi:MAG: ribokinase [Cyanobacteria bacterium P01_F01_bin.150]
MSVIVLGSINMDLVVHTPRLPQLGETLIGKRFETIPGGKGANQAVAVARQGIDTYMIGRVGDDAFGTSLRQNLQQYGVKCDRITIDASAASGVALIEVNDQGDNHIVVVPGANGQVGPDELNYLSDYVLMAKVLLLQLEIPLDIVYSAVKVAHNYGIKVILDPAPAKSLPLDLYPMLDILTPNQTEAEQLTGLSITDMQTAIAAGTTLQKRGVSTVIITMGEKGLLICQENNVRHVPAFDIEAVNTVGAGDAFNGGLAAALVEEHSIDIAVVKGMATAALSVTQSGTQSSMPNSQTLNAFLSKNYKY